MTDIVELIDNAIGDYMSDDAMRWTPEKSGEGSWLNDWTCAVDGDTVTFWRTDTVRIRLFTTAQRREAGRAGFHLTYQIVDEVPEFIGYPQWEL